MFIFIVESTPNGSGSRIVLELTEMVNDIVSEGGEALIFAHSTPSLLDEENLSKSTTFYADLFDGNVSLSESGQVEFSEYLWEEGAFFRTVLDGMKPNKFTKIPLAPPTPNSILNIGSYDALKAEEIFENWLKIMEEDTRLGNNNNIS